MNLIVLPLSGLHAAGPYQLRGLIQGAPPLWPKYRTPFGEVWSSNPSAYFVRGNGVATLPVVSNSV